MEDNLKLRGTGDILMRYRFGIVIDVKKANE